MDTREQAAEIERKTRCEERHCRITSSFFGRVCRRLSSTSLDPLVNSILNQCMYQSMPLPCSWEKDNENRTLRAYKQEWHERGHSGRK